MLHALALNMNADLHTLIVGFFSYFTWFKYLVFFFPPNSIYLQLFFFLHLKYLTWLL